VRALLASVIVGGAAGVVAASGRAAPPSPRVVGVVKTTDGRWRLEPLDAQTLAPVRGGWSRVVPLGAPVTLSPSGSRVAVAVGAIGTGAESVLVLDTLGA
jgi:hypothetical protein